MSLSVVRAGRGLRMVLDGKNRVFPVLDPLYGAVVEVQMGDFEGLGARNAAGFPSGGKPVVLRGGEYLSRREIAHGVVPTPVPVREFDRFPTQRESEQLMAEADPKDGQLPVGESPDCIDRVTDGRWVPGTVGEEDAVGFHRADLSRSRCGRHDRHAAALL